MKYTFNLVAEEWVPIVTADFQSLNVGLLDLLASAHKIKEICAATPVETAALYRLCLALLHAMILVTEDKWREIWRAKRFDGQLVSDYFQKWGYRFDLFDSARPFLQDPGLECEPEPASSLLGHIASGNDSTLFSHNTTDDSMKMTPSDAAMAVLSIQSFGVGGTKRKGNPFTDGYCARGIVFCVTGRNLFETLMLNLYDPNDLTDYRLARRGEDRPSWEMDDPYAASASRPFGLLDHLTWLNRRVLLIPIAHAPDSVYVQQMRYDAGLRTSAGAREVFNPMYHWRANTAKSATNQPARSHSPMPLNPDKALWRNSHVLLKLVNNRKEEALRDRPVAALVWLAELARQDSLSRDWRCALSAFGVATKSGQDKTFFYRAETMPLPLDLLANDDQLSKMADAITRAEGGAKVTKDALWTLARWLFAPNKLDSTIGRDDRERVQQLARSWHAEERYWGALEPHFHRLIRDLARHPENALDAWNAELRGAAKTAFDYAEGCLTGDTRAARAIAMASDQFYVSLKRLFAEQQITQESERSDN